MANTILQEGTVRTDQVNTQLLYATSAVVVGEVNGTDEALLQAQIYLPNTIPGVMVSGHVYDMGVLNSNQDLSTISFDSAPGYVQTCEVWMETGATGYSITWPTTSKWPDEYLGNPPTITLTPNKRYRFAVRSEGDGTMVITKAYEYSV
jgi:hypothetical protein